MMTSDVVITKDPDLGLGSVGLLLSAYYYSYSHKKDKSDFRYEMARAVTDVVEQIVEIIEDEVDGI